MAPASLVPSLDADIHLVLCRFGRAGLAYVETDPAEADATTVVQNLLHGRYAHPMRVIALNVDEGWSQDVSEFHRPLAPTVLRSCRDHSRLLHSGRARSTSGPERNPISHQNPLRLT